jgi:hypothetical protein
MLGNRWLAVRREQTNQEAMNQGPKQRANLDQKLPPGIWPLLDRPRLSLATPVAIGLMLATCNNQARAQSIADDGKATAAQPMETSSKAPSSEAADPTDVRSIEDLRQRRNQASFGLGDKLVFELGLDFVSRPHDAPGGIRFVTRWNQPIDVTGKNPYWNDVASLYRYFAGLEASRLKHSGELPDSLNGAIIPYEQPSREMDFLAEVEKAANGILPVFFDEMRTWIRLGAVQTIAEGAFRQDIHADSLARNSPGGRGSNSKGGGLSMPSPVIGFIISGTGLKLDFLSEPEKRINYDDLPILFPQRTIVADFPLPMHTGGGKLIELAIRRGKVVNHIFSGGRRRSGMVVIDRSGSSYPMHVQQVKPPLWAEGQAKSLDLAHDGVDLKGFLESAKKNELSVVFEMMLLDSIDGLDLRPIHDRSEPGGRRMLVWKEQADGTPALLVLRDGYFANHLTWTAYKLGFKWGIYCDVNYYDNAGYWFTENNRSVRTRFSHIDEAGKLPYHRMVLYNESSSKASGGGGSDRPPWGWIGLAAAVILIISNWLLRLLAGLWATINPAPANGETMKFRCVNRFGSSDRGYDPCRDYGSKGPPDDIVVIPVNLLGPFAPRCPCCGQELERVEDAPKRPWRR